MAVMKKRRAPVEKKAHSGETRGDGGVGKPGNMKIPLSLASF